MTMWRDLTKSESQLMKAMLSRAGQSSEVLKQLESARVTEMNDGGMGSLRFESRSSEDRRLGQTVSRAEFKDEDGVVVSAAIHLDQAGKLFELDIWKVDFSPLARWPTAEEIIIK